MSARRLLNPWFLAVVIWLVASTPGSAARLPDWAKAVTNASDHTAGHADGDADPSVVLLTERVLSFDASGRAEVRDRIAKLALTDSSGDVALGTVLLGGNWTPTSTRAWHLPPGGRAKKSGKDSVVEISDTSMFRTDNRSRSILVDEVESGSLIFFEFKADWTPFSLSNLHRFGGSEPIRIARLVVETPPDWTVTHEWTGTLQGPEPDVTQGRAVWEIHDIPAAEDEPLSNSSSGTEPVLAIALQPPASLPSGGPAVFATWNDVSSWITGLIDDRASLSADLCAGWTPSDTAVDTVGGIVDMVTRVRDRVRYVAKEVGIDGYRPSPAHETSQNLWGDCKAKSTLLQAILEHQGIAAFPVLVHATSDTTVGEQVPTLASFNHMITAIQLSEMSLPEYLHPAVVEDSILGSLLIVDSTDEFSSPGSLPSSYAGHRALVVRGTEGHLITLPGTDPEDHRVEQQLTIEVTARGDLHFTRTRALVGQPAASYRRAHRSHGRNWQEEIEHQIRDEWIGAQVKAVDIEPETAAGQVTETVSWMVTRDPGGPDERRLDLFAHIFEGLPRVSLRRRTAPVVYGFPRTLQSDVELIGIPADSAVPNPVNRSGSGWSVQSRCEAEGDTLSATGELILQKTRFEPEEFDDLRLLYRASAEIQRTSATIGVPSSTAP